MSEKKIDDGGAAFPTGDDHATCGNAQYYSPGMTLRDWFAGQAMAAIVSCYREILIHDKCEKTDRTHYVTFSESMAIDKNALTGENDGCAGIAVDAYAFADAMIAEKRRTEGGGQ